MLPPPRPMSTPPPGDGERRISRRRRRFIRAFLVIGSLLVGDQVLLCSAVVRPAASVGAMIEPSPEHGPPNYRLVPDHGSTYRSWGDGRASDVHVGPRGFRAPEPAAEAPATVVFVGDSITFGIGVDDADAFPARVAEALGDRAAVWNAGVPGYGLADFAGDAARIVGLHPDVVVLQLSRNDTLDPVPYGPVTRALAARSGFARLAWMLHFVIGSDEQRANTALSEALDAYITAGAAVIVAHEGLPDGVAVAEALRARGLPNSIELGGEAFEKLPDDPHYSAAGNRAVAARLLPEILAALGRR